MSQLTSAGRSKPEVSREDGELPGRRLSFSQRLRDETAAVHREAERTGFIRDLIRGHATLAGYRLFLQNLLPVYAALEKSLDASKACGAALAAFRHPSLRRLASLSSDLRTISDQSRSDCEMPLPETPAPETLAYVSAIERAAAEEGDTLLAHAYARYLGDLSGGQILAPILGRSLGLDPPALQFYRFADIPDTQAAKDAMRRALDTIDAASVTADQIIDEAIAAFRHNIALSMAVSRALGAAPA